MIKNNMTAVIFSALFLLVSFNVFAISPEVENDTKVTPDKILENKTKSENAVDILEKQARSVNDIDIPEKQALIEPAVFIHKVKGEMNKVYKRLFTGLENNGYYVIFEPNLGRNLAHFSKRWGKDYNKNKLNSIRSMVFCNGWYANKISNEDPNMLALCPLHVTLINKEGLTSILFIKPSQISQGSAANSVALELEQDVIRVIKESAR